MVQNIINLDEKEDRILNIIKAKHGFKNKSQAVAFLVKKYEEVQLEHNLKLVSDEKNVYAHQPDHKYIG